MRSAPLILFFLLNLFLLADLLHEQLPCYNLIGAKKNLEASFGVKLSESKALRGLAQVKKSATSETRNSEYVKSCQSDAYQTWIAIWLKAGMTAIVKLITTCPN